MLQRAAPPPRFDVGTATMVNDLTRSTLVLVNGTVFNHNLFTSPAVTKAPTLDWLSERAIMVDFSQRHWADFPGLYVLVIVPAYTEGSRHWSPQIRLKLAPVGS